MSHPFVPSSQTSRRRTSPPSSLTISRVRPLKLDSHYRDKEPAFGSTVPLASSKQQPCSLKTTSLSTPSTSPVDVLQHPLCHIPSTQSQRAVPLVFFQFLTHLRRSQPNTSGQPFSSTRYSFSTGAGWRCWNLGITRSGLLRTRVFMAEHIFGNKKVASKASSSTRLQLLASPSCIQQHHNLPEFQLRKCSGQSVPSTECTSVRPAEKATIHSWSTQRAPRSSQDEWFTRLHNPSSLSKVRRAHITWYLAPRTRFPFPMHLHSLCYPFLHYAPTLTPVPTPHPPYQQPPIRLIYS